MHGNSSSDDAPGVITNTHRKSTTRYTAEIALGVSLAIAGKAQAITVMPTIITTCACATFADLQAAATTFAQNGWATSWPSYGGAYMSSGYTQIVAISTTAPLMFPFNFTITDHPIVTPVGTFHSYTASTTPASTAPATMIGAHALEATTSARASGLPPIVMPPSSSPTDDQETLSRTIGSILVLVPGSTGQRTLPGLLNWSFFPSYKVVNLQDGKTYTLYNGDTMKIKFSNGKVLTLHIDVSTVSMTVGPYKLDPPTTSTTAPASNTAGPAISFASLNGQPGYPSLIIWSDNLSGPTGTVIVEEIPDASSVYFGSSGTVIYFDVISE